MTTSVVVSRMSADEPPASALQYWDVVSHCWTIENGPVVVEAGASSADIRLTTTLVVTGQR